MGETDTSASSDPLSLLLSVQEKDLQLDRLEYRRRELPARKELSLLDASLEELSARVAELRAERQVLQKRQTEIEGHVASYEARIKAIEARMQQGGDYRDAQAMSAEVGSLARHKRGLEDDELEVMEALEPLDQKDGELTAKLGELASTREELASEVASEAAEIDAEAAVLTTERAELAARLPAELAGSYKRLRERLGGIGAAKLVDGRCSGCHLQLPSSERESLLRAPAGTVAYCEQCGRILVP
jgi:predicted  nucleic acid-binding Zn-ribbon protein